MLPHIPDLFIKRQCEPKLPSAAELLEAWAKAQADLAKAQKELNAAKARLDSVETVMKLKAAQSI